MHAVQTLAGAGCNIAVAMTAVATSPPATEPDVAAAQLPLAGGQEGATVTLQPLLCAVMRGPKAFFERTAGAGATLKAMGVGASAADIVDVPIVAFLIEHPGAGHVLIDTGFRREVAERSSPERSRSSSSAGATERDPPRRRRRPRARPSPRRRRLPR